MQLAFRYLGTPWALGNSGAASIDCSGLLANVFDAMGIHTLARHSGVQIRQGQRVWERTAPTDDLAMVLRALPQPPIVLGRPGHVVLYLGERADQHWVLQATVRGGTIVSPITRNGLDRELTTALSF